MKSKSKKLCAPTGKGKGKHRRARTRKLFCLLAVVLLILLLGGVCAERFRLYVVLSGSMEPALNVGSVVAVDRKRTNPEPGEILTFQRDGRNVTHRVEEKTSGGYITRGDANQEADQGIVRPGEVVGTVVFQFPYIGYGVVWLQEYREYLAGICFALLLFLLLLPEKSTRGKSAHLRTDAAVKKTAVHQKRKDLHERRKG